ncbi:helix-turn-helix transcriptional regulator [Rhizobium leguminosarum]|uniref:helix-turn-helix domain-containing protein n=1 Tax=Rhizobium leguminosarum TaxID=384 RepID=UPI001C963456|nr:helix-turn-helix transcriptional regulator [Rhizobium leguminosarum]MBY5551290.1 helix-turn-helix transcriptional regulator [Rhizobium leguminosarum]
MNHRSISPQGVHPVDVHVGKRILLARHARRMTQQDLARQLGMTFQQVQKYEKGKNRVSASVLYEIMQTLDVPASYFFDGFPTEEAVAEEAGAVTTKDVNTAPSLFTAPENVTLLHNYLEAPPTVRKAVRSLLSSIAKEET